jgi:hypothetical protein
MGFALGSKPLILRLFLHPPEAEISTLFLFALKEMGGFALMLAVMAFFAARDPVRNVAIIDAFTVGLCILAVTPLVSRWMLDIQSIYPGHPSKEAAALAAGENFLFRQ